MSSVAAVMARGGDTVEYPLPGNAGVAIFVIHRVHNSTPDAGQITWEARDGKTHVIGAARRVNILNPTKETP